MIGASKILTVSYGTFSCTLEGFDDPFNTMRAIAEYFRDLAAEDRYFGAEPPTPDAAMLLKIAEREVQRRVEAKIQENGVVLRTGDAMQAPAFAPAPAQQASDVQPPLAQTPRSVAPRAEPEPAPMPSPMPDGVAAKLLRIRAAVSNGELAATRTELAVAVAPVAPILAEYTEDQHADDFDSADAFVAPFDEPTFPAEIADADVWDQPEITAEDAVAAEAAAQTADNHPSQDQLAELPDAPALSAEPDLDVAALSDRLNQTPSPADEAPVAASVADADFADLAAAIAAPEDNTSTDFDFAASEDGASEDGADDADLSDAEFANEAMADADYAISAEDLADLRALDADTDHGALPQPAADDYDEDYDASPQIGDSAAVDAKIDDAFADIEDLAEQTADDAVDPILAEIDSAYAPEDEPARGPSEKVLRARARVIKVRSSEAAVVPEKTLADTIPAEATAEVAAMLAADKEDGLRRDLRALQVDTDTPNPNDVDDEAGSEDDARKRLDAAGEEAVSRLIEQTNEAMAVPENRRRLSAIAHLKAAVAATVADRFSKGSQRPKEPDTTRLDPYRDDLARVVRPQHPGTSEDAPSTPRPAPLVLVSAQRIDRPRTAPGDSTTPLASVPTAPIRPRRVTSAQVAVEPVVEIDEEDEDIDATTVFADARGFAEFSERLGANSLAEILEAAAAYSVCVEGRPYFSRPQLMGQIGALSSDSEYTREDGLRTFGALLRDGRIQKIKRGQFVLTESSHYLAEARKISG